ncbi:hypothetical protein F4679DRAFT_555168, partial [Xylaria curta]
MMRIHTSVLFLKRTIAAIAVIRCYPIRTHYSFASWNSGGACIAGYTTLSKHGSIVLLGYCGSVRGAVLDQNPSRGCFANYSISSATSTSFSKN